MTDWEPLQVSTLASLPEFTLYQTLEKFNKLSPNPNKELISHQYGVQGSKDILKPHQSILDSLQKNAKDAKLSGYTHSCGFPKAREALGEFYSTPDYKIPVEYVVLFQGHEMAQNHIMRALCNPGDNFVIPSPCVGLWEETAPGYELTCKRYNLLPEKNWEVDLKDLESKIDEKTKFILIVNPSNPAGTVYSESHLKEILAIAEKYKIPIVSDEGLEGTTFAGTSFTSLGKISGDVPVLQMGGLAEQYCAFGWNTTWVIMYDRKNVMVQFNKGVQSIMQLMLHPATYISNVIPDVLKGPHTEYLAKEVLPVIKENVEVIVEGLKKLEKYFTVVKSEGGFSLLARVNFANFKDIANEQEFVEKLYTEESVKLLPSKIYHYEGAVRIVTCLEKSVYPEFLNRLEAFCQAHGK